MELNIVVCAVMSFWGRRKEDKLSSEGLLQGATVFK